MASYSISLTRNQQDQLAEICRAGPDQLEQAIRAIESGATTIRPRNILAMVAPILGDVTGKALVDLATSLIAFANRTQTPHDEIVEAIQNLIKGYDWPADRIQAWERCRHLFKQLLAIKSLALTAKTTDLLYDFDNLLLSSRIITDIRPTFDDGRENILGAAVTQTLRLEWYLTDGSRKSISIAMDADDIKNLRKCCDLALLKAEAVSKMNDKNKIETRAANEAGNDAG